MFLSSPQGPLGQFQPNLASEGVFFFHMYHKALFQRRKYEIASKGYISQSTPHAMSHNGFPGMTRLLKKEVSIIIVLLRMKVQKLLVTLSEAEVDT